MAFPRPFTLVTLNGTIAGGNEIWSASFHMGAIEQFASYDAWRAQYESLADEYVTRIEAMYSDPRVKAPYDAPLTSVKFAYLDTAGKYIGESLEYEASARGTNNTGYLPQGTLVTTFVNPLKFKDPGRYNRFYLPIAPADLGGLWRLSTNDQNDYAACLADFVGDMALITSGTEPVTQVMQVMSSSGAGYANDVTQVRIGGIVDTQRRRRNKLPEAYVTAEAFPS